MAAPSACWTEQRTSASGRDPRSPACAASDLASRLTTGGSLVSAELRPIEGGEQIARAFIDLARRAPNLTILERTVNGQPGLVAQLDGVTVAVLACDVAGDRIKRIWVVRNPEKLRPWTTG